MSKSPVTCHGKVTNLFSAIETCSSRRLNSPGLLAGQACSRRRGGMARTRRRQHQRGSRRDRHRVRRSEACPDPSLARLNPNSKTDADGRCMQLWPSGSKERAKLQDGKLYKVIFNTKDYFESTGRKCFYPWVEVRGQAQHKMANDAD